MTDCRKVEALQACFVADDGSGSYGIFYVPVFDDKGASIGGYYADENGDAIDEASYLGGGVASIGECSVAYPECVESQEWTYGIDNTGTTFSDVADYVIMLSDGSQLNFSQGGTSTGWTPQLNEWSANIQAAADAAGLAWFVEPRAVNNIIPTDISGNYGGTPTGLPGAPSVAVAQALISGGMAARYVNIQICPGQPVPVSAERVTSAVYTNNPYSLTTAGAILGPIQKFVICRECGKEPVWYLEDGVTLAPLGQIPNCYEPCGTLALASAPPDRDCTFEISVACDNNNSQNTVDFVNTITRRATVCNGEQIAVDYFQEDPNDASALIAYTLVGDFVDCATGEPIALPVPECSNFELTTLFTMSGIDGQLRNREWETTQSAFPTTAGTAEGRSVREAHDFSLPTTVDSLVSSIALNDTNNIAGLLDIQVIEDYVVVSQPVIGEYFGSSEGYWAFELGACCGDLELLAESGGFNATRTMRFEIPAGVHKIRIWNIDSAGSNSSATFRYSVDGGATFITDNTPPMIKFSTVKPEEKCVQVKVCEDTGAIIGLLTGEVLDPADFYDCSRLCSPAEKDNLAPFKTICPDASLVPDANYEGAMPITSGRPNPNVAWALIDNRDSGNQVTVAEGATFQEFSDNLEAAGYSQFIQGEVHYISPCPPGYTEFTPADGQYFTEADGNTVTKGGCTPLTELSSAPEKVVGDEKCALQTIGCLDELILDELKALNTKPIGVIENCDGSTFWTVNPDGTFNGPFANPSAPAETEIVKG